MGAFSFGSLMSIVLQIINNRESILKIIQEVQKLWPQIMDIIQKVAPEAIPGGQPLPIEAQPDESGYSMTWLQESLNTLENAKLDVDGEYGPSTAAAIKKFQQKYGLVADGWAGPTTTAKVLELLSAK